MILENNKIAQMNTKNSLSVQCLSLIIFVFFSISSVFCVNAEDLSFFGVEDPRKVDAKSIVVMEYANGDILYSYDPELIIPPASLTKIMTMFVSQDAIKDGNISLDTKIQITKTDATLPYRSSTMNLQEGMIVRFEDLLKGMAIVSGNDAALTTARVISGSVENFASKMNEKAKALGLKNTSYVEPSGLSELNLTCASDMAKLARTYIHTYPEALELYHSQKEFLFPKENPNLYSSTNELLRWYEGCDGLKTGYIDESGYNFVVTAKRDDSRFISVTLGGVQGLKARSDSGETLLNWAFENWITVSPEVPEIKKTRVWNSKEKNIYLEMESSPTFTIPRKYKDNIKSRVEYFNKENEIFAPIQKGQKLAQIVYSSGETILKRINLVAKDEVQEGNFIIKFFDLITRFFTNLFSKK